MASNFYSPTLISRKPTLPHRFVAPNSHFKIESPPRSCFRKPFNQWDRNGIRIRPLGPTSFPVSGISGGGDGGDSSGGGGSGGGGGGGSEGGGNLRKLMAWYLCLLENYPVRTKAATSALLNLFGDLVCQLVIDKTPSLDLKRIARFTLLGFCLVGPTLHFWYLYLSKLVTATGAFGAAIRLVLDQFVFAPMFIGAFFTALMTLEGKPLQVIPKLQQEWFSSVVANWQLWIPFQFLNFRFVPQQLQVLASNFVALAWNVFLSYKAHKEVQLK